MALIVEDGNGLSNAESYVSVADADLYHIAFGNAAWSALTLLAKEVALRKATAYMDSRYKFRGMIRNLTQALMWPRYDYGSNDIQDLGQWPVARVHKACCELALIASTTALWTNEDFRPVIEETVGPITVRYGDAVNGGQVRFSAIDDILAPLTAGSGRMGLRIERAS